MKFISEAIIEDFIDKIGEDENLFFKLDEEIQNNHVDLYDFLSDEDLSVLTEEEYELLWFLVIVIFGCVKEFYPNAELTIVKELAAIDESNWQKYNNAKGNSFREKISVFFENHPQEDLLAFVEDSIEEDEELQISSSGKEVIFITCTSIIDALNLLA